MELQIAQPGMVDTFVMVHGYAETGIVLGAISRDALEDAVLGRHISDAEGNLLVDRHREAFGRIMAGKLERGEVTREPGKMPRIDILAADLAASGERLSASVLDISHSWV